MPLSLEQTRKRVSDAHRGASRWELAGAGMGLTGLAAGELASHYQRNLFKDAAEIQAVQARRRRRIGRRTARGVPLWRAWPEAGQRAWRELPARARANASKRLLWSGVGALAVSGAAASQIMARQRLKEGTVDSRVRKELLEGSLDRSAVEVEKNWLSSILRAGKIPAEQAAVANALTVRNTVLRPGTRVARAAGPAGAAGAPNVRVPKQLQRGHAGSGSWFQSGPKQTFEPVRTTPVTPKELRLKRMESDVEAVEGAQAKRLSRRKLMAVGGGAAAGGALVGGAGLYASGRVRERQKVAKGYLTTGDEWKYIREGRTRGEKAADAAYLGGVGASVVGGFRAARGLPGGKRLIAGGVATGLASRAFTGSRANQRSNEYRAAHGLPRRDWRGYAPDVPGSKQKKSLRRSSQGF